MTNAVAEAQEVALLKLLDRVVDLVGDITISVADVDLIYLRLKIMLASVERASRSFGRSMRWLGREVTDGYGPLRLRHPTPGNTTASRP
jgi:hypothetical protein